MSFHGYSETITYASWKAMIWRCTNPKSKKYARYGGRGIEVCARWRKFENFFADMGERPSRLHTLDRRDNDGNYDSGNCRWATKRQQSANIPRNMIVTAFGRTCALAEFFENSICKEYDRTHYRISAGWNVERAITAPPHAGRNP